VLVVLSPQPARNPNPTLNMKPLFLQKVMEDEVAAPTPLLLIKKNILQIKPDLPL